MEGILALLIPIVALSIPIVAIWTKHQRRLAEMHLTAGTGQTAQIVQDAAEKIAALENRVRVLERIVTDKGNLLASEIEALRLSEKAQ